jgi:hypothetical protein
MKNKKNYETFFNSQKLFMKINFINQVDSYKFIGFLNVVASYLPNL